MFTWDGNPNDLLVLSIYGGFTDENYLNRIYFFVFTKWKKLYVGSQVFSSRIAITIILHISNQHISLWYYSVRYTNSAEFVISQVGSYSLPILASSIWVDVLLWEIVSLWVFRCYVEDRVFLFRQTDKNINIIWLAVMDDESRKYWVS